ncbi:MAG TPA: DUF2442 domain-containing protein [Verrucomicrobiae bacterium]
MDLTEEQLEALFWAVGEYGYRADQPLAILRQYATKGEAYARYMAGLRGIADFAYGQPPMNLESFLKRLGTAIREARAEEELQTPPVRSLELRDGFFIVGLEGGMEIRFPVKGNPKLAAATDEQLKQIKVSEYGLHWPSLNCGISFQDLMIGDFGQQPESPAGGGGVS